MRISLSRICSYVLLLVAVCAGFSACQKAKGKTEIAETTRLTKTLFTEKLGAFLVYAPLKAGQASEFALHLTNLAEGTPVGKATVTLLIRAKSNQQVTTFKAAPSETLGVYSATVTFPQKGEYYVECELKHEQFNGRLTMTDFDVE